MNKPRSIYHLLLLMLCLCCYPVEISPQTGGTFDLSHSVIATGGGSNSTGGTFQVDGTAGQGFAGTTSNATAFDLHGGFWFQNQAVVNFPQITGTVTYGNATGSPNPRFVSNVTITGTGSPTVMATTAAPGPTAGQYTLAGFGAGSYTVTPTKTGGVNSITSFDAAKIAQHVSGISSLTGNALIAADTSGNNVVSSFDAGLIARFVVGSPGAMLTGTWEFYSVPNPPFPRDDSLRSRTYASVTSNIAGEDYVGILVGEVSGNWTNTGARPVGSRQSAAGRGLEKSIAVDLPNVVEPVDKEIVVPVNVQSRANKEIISYEFDLRYDPSVIQPVADVVDVAGSVSSRLSVVTNATEPGLLRVVVYGAMPIDENGVLLNLRFTAVGAHGSVSPLTWERMMFNEGEPRVMAVDGLVELSKW